MAHWIVIGSKIPSFVRLANGILLKIPYINTYLQINWKKTERNVVI